MPEQESAKDVIRKRKTAQEIRNEGQIRKDLEGLSQEQIWQIGSVFYHLVGNAVVAIRYTDP